MRAVGMNESEFFGFLLDVPGQSLRQIVACHQVLPLGADKKYPHRGQQQHSRYQHHGSDSLDREAHELVSYAQARGQPLRQALAQFAPQQPRRGSRKLFR
jgi:hypothetical protein